MFAKQLFPSFSNYAALVGKNIRSTIINNRITPNVDLVRYAARKGTRAANLAAKKARKLKEAGKPQPIPKYLQRKIKISAELERKRCVDENWLETNPIDNVWNMKLYRGKPYSVSEAIEMFRELHQPEMLDDSKALLYANIELDLKLKKKDKYLEELSGSVTFPHQFDAFRNNRIIVLCKSTEDQTLATDAGAVYSGSQTLIKQILSGTISSDEYDYVICHPDMLKEANTLRGILGKKFPNTFNGLLRLDIEPAVKNFLKAIDFKLKRSNVEVDFGWVDICFGRINMPTEELEKNLKHCLEIIEKLKPAGTQEQLFIIRTLLFCEKSREKFKIPHWNYLTNYPENGVIVEETADEDEINESKTN
ncbi:large ribosomal subunit protein uL1 [Parasteatoda tepidariorum]|uniref:large ribosomal subunit protein uL1 n=1 Tax=Parasteatoda tepidariorum TaxID=114398 RepID=UPI00077FA8CD|nr:50S ribosomal protein L1 [Parasteatoda tepidariorum]